MNAPMPTAEQEQPRKCFICDQRHPGLCWRIERFSQGNDGKMDFTLKAIPEPVAGTWWQRFQTGFRIEKIAGAAGQFIGWMIGIALLLLFIKIAERFL